MDWRDLDTLEYVYLVSIREPKPRSLELVIEQAAAADFDEALVPPDTDPPTEIAARPCVVHITFQSYIGYAVRNESLARNDTDEDHRGALARVYTRSLFLAFLQATLLAGALKADRASDAPTHYALMCLEHVVDVVSSTPPIITRSS